jgi:hypothetical protein
MLEREGAGPLGMKFDVVRFDRGKPPQSKKLAAQNFLELHADIFQEPTVDAIAAASALFGIEEDTAKKYLQWRRGRRKHDSGWSIEFEREIGNAMREHGYQGYQELAVVLKNSKLRPLTVNSDLW